jgi:hypothetical protein
MRSFVRYYPATATNKKSPSYVSDTDVGNYTALTTVQNGDQIYLSCRAYHALDYCWFRHPTGFHLRFSTEVLPLDGLLEAILPRYYVYDDTLQSGVCAVRVFTANRTVDSGQWTCHMGVLGSPAEDHEMDITVRVSGEFVP